MNNQRWRKFGDKPLEGVYWVCGKRTEVDCDVDDYGHPVGHVTGETTKFVSLVHLSYEPKAGLKGLTQLSWETGTFDEYCDIHYVMPYTAPELPEVLSKPSPLEEAGFKVGDIALWFAYRWDLVKIIEDKGNGEALVEVTCVNKRNSVRQFQANVQNLYHLPDPLANKQKQHNGQKQTGWWERLDAFSECLHEDAWIQGPVNFFLYGEPPGEPEAHVEMVVGYFHKMLKACPEVKAEFEELEKASPRWKAFLDNWDRIEETYLEERKSTLLDLPDTYKLLKNVLDEATNKPNQENRK